MKKYIIGIIVIAILSFGLFAYVVSVGVAGKQDIKTEKQAKEVAKELNNFVSKNNKIPDSLDETKVKDIPDTIKYSKQGTDKYEFCVTYKTASQSSYMGIEDVVTGATARSLDTNYDDYSDSESKYERSSLYLSYTHKKGENCQVVKPYIYKAKTNSRQSTDKYDYSNSSLCTGANAARYAEYCSSTSPLEDQ